MDRAFCGLIICYMLLSILIVHEENMQEYAKETLESKQGIIDYQLTEQKRVELMNYWERKIENALKVIGPSMKTVEALGIFCSQIKLNECMYMFRIDVYQKQAILIQDLTISENNYSITFQKGGFFSAKL